MVDLFDGKIGKTYTFTGNFATYDGARAGDSYDLTCVGNFAK